MQIPRLYSGLSLGSRPYDVLQRQRTKGFARVRLRKRCGSVSTDFFVSRLKP
jgi:hypothetical protein